MGADTWLPFKMHPSGTHTFLLTNVLTPLLHNSITVQRNHIKLGVHIALDSSSLSLILGLSSSFSFGVVSVLLSRFDAPFKCTVNKTL